MWYRVSDVDCVVEFCVYIYNERNIWSGDVYGMGDIEIDVYGENVCVWDGVRSWDFEVVDLDGGEVCFLDEFGGEGVVWGYGDGWVGGVEEGV